MGQDYIAHYGIKGQRWGVRRFQNEDGSLTKAGQERYNKYQTRADNAAKSAKEMSYWRKKTEEAGRKYGHAWSVYGADESEDAQTAIKYQKKADRIVNKNLHKSLEASLRESGVEVTKYSKKAQDIANNYATSKLLFKTNTKGMSDKEIEDLTKEYFEESLNKQESDRLGITSSESSFEKSSYALSSDKKVSKQINDIIDQNSEPLKNVENVASSYVANCDKRNRQFEKCLEDYEKKHGKWSGDGSEAHSEMKKRYSEYKKISDEAESSLKSYIQEIKSIVKSGMFDGLKIPKDKYKNLYVDFGNWYQKSDPREFAVAIAICERMTDKKTAKNSSDYDMLPMFFIESYDKQTNKRIRSAHGMD